MGQSASLGGRGTPEDRNDGDLCGGKPFKQLPHSLYSCQAQWGMGCTLGWGAVEGESIGQAYGGKHRASRSLKIRLASPSRCLRKNSAGLNVPRFRNPPFPGSLPLTGNCTP